MYRCGRCQITQVFVEERKRSLEFSRRARLRASLLLLSINSDIELIGDEEKVQSAGDIAYSMNNTKAYKFLMQEGIRAEMLRAVMEDAAQLENDKDDDTIEEEEEEVSKEPEKEEEEEDSKMIEEPNQKPSTASSLSHYLSEPLTYAKDSSGQDVCLDSEGNGVMMGWEREIMRETVEKMLGQGWGDRKGKKREVLVEEEEGERTSLTVVNVGFGLGIVSSFATRNR